MPTAQQPPNLMAEDSAQFEDAFEAIIAKHAAPEPAAPAAAAPTQDNPAGAADAAVPDGGRFSSDVYKRAFDQVAAADADVRPAVATPTQPAFKSFGEAFKHYRSKGDKTFDWKGKQFTTALRSERPAKPKAARTRALPAAAPIQAAQPAKVVPTPFKVSAPAQALYATPQPTAPRPSAVPTQPREKPLHLRRQEAYEKWQDLKSEGKTWYGGKAQLKPGQQDAIDQAEREFEALLHQVAR